MPHKSNRTHKAHGVQNQLHTLQWEVLEHSAYSPHDFHIYSPWKKSLKSCTGMLHNDVQKADLGSSQIEFSEDGMYQLMHQCNSCLNADGDFLFFKLL